MISQTKTKPSQNKSCPNPIYFQLGEQKEVKVKENWAMRKMVEDEKEMQMELELPAKADLQQIAGKINNLEVSCLKNYQN